MHSWPRYSLKRGNLQGAFKEHLSQVRTKRHTQIERDQNSTPKVPGLSRPILCRIFFSPLNATDQNPGSIQNEIFFNLQVQIEICAHECFWLY
jgi:hypothetical protein